MSVSVQAWIKSLCCILWLSGCASTWVPPTTSEGRLCVAECRVNRQQCMANVNNAVANCANQVATQLHAYDDPQIDAETGCADDPAVNAAFSKCELRYRECFIACGGSYR